MKVLLVAQKTDSAIKYYRQLMPHDYMMDNKTIEAYIMQTFDYKEFCSIPDSFFKEYHIIQFCRYINLEGKTKEVCERLQSLGLKVVFDVDDYWELPTGHSLKPVYEYHSVPKQTTEAIQYSNHTTTTTGYLADKVMEYNSNVTVVANCIDTTQKQFEQNKTESYLTRIGWVGGIFHYDDIEPLHKSFQKLHKDKDIKDQYQVVLGGFNVANKRKEYVKIERILTDEYRGLDWDYTQHLQKYTEVGDHISLSKPYRRLWGKPITDYAGMYNEIDVVLAPLRYNDFSNCKSELKLIEAGTMGCAAIANDAIPYKHFPITFVDYNKPHKDWYEKIKYYIKNKEAMQANAAILSDYVKTNYNIANISKTRLDLYKWLVSE